MGSKVKDREKDQDRKFCAILYPDATNYDCASALKAAEEVAEFAYILHDRDTDDDGVLEKAHYHVLLRFKSSRYIQTVANKLGIPANNVQFCGKFSAAEKYLVHRTPDAAGKYKYSPDEVITNIGTYLSDVGEMTEGQIMLSFMAAVDKGCRNPYELVRMAAHDENPAVYATLRRNWSIISGYCNYNSAPADRVRYAPTVTVNMDVVQEIERMAKQ